jgi:hypothetical protein
MVALWSSTAIAKAAQMREPIAPLPQTIPVDHSPDRALQIRQCLVEKLIDLLSPRRRRTALANRPRGSVHREPGKGMRVLVKFQCIDEPMMLYAEAA